MSVRDRYETALAVMRERIRVDRAVSPGKRLGELLMERGVLDRETLERALAEQRRRGGKELLGEVLISLGFVGNAELREALRAQAGMK